MEQVTESVSDQPQVDGSAAQVDQSVEVKDQVSYDTHRKLLGQHKKMRGELDELRSANQLASENKLQAEGKKDEVIDSLREQLRTEKDGRSKERTSYAWDRVTNQVKMEATKQGCKDPDMLIDLLTKDELATIQVSDDFKVNFDDVRNVIESRKLKHNNIGLFSSDVSQVKDLPLGRVAVEKKGMDDLSLDEKLKLFGKSHLSNA